MNSAAIELGRKQTDTVGAVADCAASALLRGARGNSGVILSLLFRGVAKSLKGRETASAAEFAAAVSAGVDAAYKAVMKPAEGTILTVSRLGAQAAVAFAKDSTDFEGMLDALLAAAREALADTQNINPVLRRAGVVDAGGEGFVLVMDAMLGYLQGRTAAPVTSAAPAAAQAPKEGADFSEFDTGEITFGYCTEFIVARENSKSPELLRSFLKNLGDCVVVVDDDEIIKVHVHTNVPGEVLTEALTYGPLQTVKIENMRNQHTALSGKETEAEAAAKAEAEPEVAQPEKQFGVVAVSAGEGMANLFRELGVDRVVTVVAADKVGHAVLLPEHGLEHLILHLVRAIADNKFAVLLLLLFLVRLLVIGRNKAVVRIAIGQRNTVYLGSRCRNRILHLVLGEHGVALVRGQIQLRAILRVGRVHLADFSVSPMSFRAVVSTSEP